MSTYAFGSGSGGSSGSGTSIVSPLSGFGELEVVQPTPTAQVDFIYNINPLLLSSYAYGPGAGAVAIAGEARLTSGTADNNYMRLFAKRVVNYRPGQGVLIRGTARFGAAGTVTANTVQRFGAGNPESGYYFGYQGTTFGIYHVSDGTVEVQSLTVTVAGGAGNIQVTLDGGPAVTVASPGGTTVAVANAIAGANYASIAGGWDAMALGNVVYFVRRIAGPAGASSYNPLATGSAANFVTTTLGVNNTTTFIPQNTWNVDPMDGSGPSGVTLNLSRGNIYQIQYQYLGYGDAFFSVEDPDTGRFVAVHLIKNANARVGTVLRNPSGYITWEAGNSGGAVSSTLVGASGASFVEGNEQYLGPLASYVFTKTAGAGVETPILSIRSTRVYNARYSTGQVRLARITVACDGTKSVEIKVYKNGSTLVGPNWTAFNLNTSIVDYDTTASSLSGGSLVYTFTVAKTSNTTENVLDLNLFAQAGEAFTLTALSQNANDVSASMVWVED